MKIIFASPLAEAHWPWPTMNLAEVAQAALLNKLYMPGIGYIHIENLQDWNANLGDAANSKRLWLNSLVSAHTCLRVANEQNQPELKQVVATLVASYLNSYNSDRGIFKDAWRDEHAVANRLFVLTALLHDSCQPRAAPISQLDLLFHADHHARWLEDDAHYVQNNHGVMMDLALAQFSVFIQELDSQSAQRYRITAMRRLEMMLKQTFDSKGYCTENSPAYHFVNYSLFSTIKQFVDRYHLTRDTSKWNHILQAAKNAGHLLLRSDGTIPLVGDSESRPGTFFPDSKTKSGNGIGYFPEGGLFVANLPFMHMTLRGGGMKFSHRHIDDLSLTLWVHGKDFVVDGGLYNYDIQDKLRRWFISSRSHSGFYLESAGDVRYANFSSPSAMSRFNSMHGTQSEFSVSASHNLSKEAEVKRDLSFSNDILQIEDAFTSETEQNWRYQLILHPDVELYALSDQNGFRLKNGEHELIWRLVNADHAPEIENSHYSPSFMAIHPCKVIIVRGKAKQARVCTEFHLNIK